MVRSTTLGLAAVLLLAACTDRRDPISPRSQGPALAIRDGAHNGNDDFFFMPPMAANPSSRIEFDAGAFNAKLLPVVSICLLDADDPTVCETDIKTFDASAISVGDELYHVNWNTSESDLDVTRLYRITVTVGTEVVGYMDVDPVSTGKELRSVSTGEYIGLVDGKTLPIKFRIEKGISCANKSDCAEESVTNAGGIVVTNTYFAGVDFPSGWLPIDESTGKPYQSVVVKIERVAVGPDNICHVGLNLLQFEGCYEFTTDPYVGRFAKPVVAGICPEIGPDDPRYHMLVFYKSGANEATEEAPERAAPFVNCRGFAGTPGPLSSLDRVTNALFAFAGQLGGALAPKSAHAIDVGFGGELEMFSRGSWALDAELEVVGGNGQSAAPGALLGTPISVRATGHHGDPVEGVPVTFAAAAGSVSTVTVVTDENGIATTNWTLGATPGAQTLTVTGKARGTLTFSATAVQVLGSVTLAATRIDFGQPQQTSAQVPMTQLDASGNPMNPEVPCVWTITSARQSMSVSQTGLVSATQDDDGTVTAVCGNKSAGAAVEAGNYVFTATGSLQDPTGDSQSSSAGSPDLVGLTGTVAQRNLTFDVFYDLASVTSANPHTNISIDIDQDVNTGHPGMNSTGTLDAALISADYILVIDNGTAVLRKNTGTVNSFTFVVSVACSITDNTATRRISCTVPFSKLGYDEGYLNFKATSAANLGNGANTGILDQISNVGQPVGSTGSPIQ